MSEVAQVPHSSPDGNIPQLRFPEFGKRWDKETIGGISKIFGRIGYRGYTVQDIVSKGEGAIALSPSNFINNQINTIKSTYISWFKYEESPEIKILDGDILFVKTGSTYGKTAFVSNIKEKATINPQIVVLKNISISNKFLGYIVTTQTIKKQIEQIVVGGAIPTMSQKELSKMEFSLPAKPEQQKIAAFLTAVDSKIEQLSKKKALLGEYKKGLMQQIFSQAIRFKADDDSEFPDWEERVLGDYLAHKSKKNKNNEVDLVLSVSNKKGFITQDEQFDGYQVASKDLTNYKIVEKGEYAYNPSRINVGSIARLKNNTIGIVSPMYVVFKLKNLDSIFFDNLYQTHLFKHLIKVGCSGSVRDSLNFNDMADFVFSFPSLEEQAKIVNFLSSIDSKIEQVGKQLDESKQFKKALLQQMFV